MGMQTHLDPEGVLNDLEIILDEISYFPRLRTLKKITTSECAIEHKKRFVLELQDHGKKAGVFYKPFELLELWHYFKKVNFDIDKLREKLLEYYPLGKD